MRSSVRTAPATLCRNALYARAMAANRQPALAAYALADDGKHRPYGLMVLQIEGDLICGLPSDCLRA